MFSSSKKNKDFILQQLNGPKNSNATPLDERDEEKSDFFSLEKKTLKEEFKYRLENLSGNFYYASSFHQSLDKIKALIGKENKSIYCFESKIKTQLKALDMQYKDACIRDIEKSIGISTCEALIAATGSILVTFDEYGDSFESIYPDLHIVIASERQLYQQCQEAILALVKKYNPLPSFSLITGPSRTADIEKKLIIGAHGPKNLWVFLYP